VDGGRGWNTEEKKVTFQQLLHNHYARSAGSMIIVKEDPREYIACGFTELIEVMAMSRPVILTRTGALPTEIDVEAVGCGLHIPPDDPDALADAIEKLAQDPERAEEMGKVGRKLCESYYNIDRFARDLHTFFESL
jgi:glycosyltransferase involved in cell wall biosynthesis